MATVFRLNMVICLSARNARRFLKGIREIAEKKHCRELGAYHCLGFDTFGPLNLVGGIAKGHPTEEEIAGAAKFYRGL